MTLKLNRKQTLELIQQIEANGGDASELRRELETSGPLPQAVPRSALTPAQPEEETAEQRLERRVGDLFPEGIPFEEIVEYDRRFTMEQLREKARKAGIGMTGDKKELAAKLILHLAEVKAGMRERVQQAIDSIKGAVDKDDKARSVRRIESELNRVDADIVEGELIEGLNELRAAIEDYRGITREGLTPEEYRKAKEEAFQEIALVIEHLEIDQDALEKFEPQL